LILATNPSVEGEAITDHLYIGEMARRKAAK
jgi:recombinational DNA repair protein RecR